MKVRCARIIDELTGEPLSRNSWLTVGKMYLVLAVYVADGEATKFRLLGDDEKTPALHKSDQFDIVSNLISSTWRVHSVLYKYFELSPESWSIPGFWEQYFDGDQMAIKVFFKEYHSMLKEENDDAAREICL